MSHPKPIVLWCHPRSVSSALERAFMQRPDFKCLHEPYGDPYYYNLSERLSKRYTDDEIRSNHPTKMTIQYSDVTSQLLSSPGHGKRIFSKDMAQYIVSPDTQEVIVTLENLRKMDNVFLIRSPALSCPSYYRCCIGSAAQETHFAHYDPNEAGYRELRILFDYIRLHGVNGSNSVVLIDADTLTADPEATLKLVCEKIGVQWDQRMLTWKKEKVKEFEKWPGFHTDAENSTGFRTQVNSGNHNRDEELPRIVQQTIDENMPIYEYLKSFALIT